MPGLLSAYTRPDHPVLLAVAAPAELRALLLGLDAGPVVVEPWKVYPARDGVEVLLTGIGKVNAAAAVARTLDPARHSGVVSLGVAGTLPNPGGRAMGIGGIVLASLCVYADEGIETPDGFQECAAMGFPLGDFPGNGVPVSNTLSEAISPLAGMVAPIATVSTCSGTDALAARVASRTGAAAEAMEGAAIAHVAHRLGVPMAELRVISNTTGDRGGQVWDLRMALGVLREAASRLAV